MKMKKDYNGFSIEIDGPAVDGQGNVLSQGFLVLQFTSNRSDYLSAAEAGQLANDIVELAAEVDKQNQDALYNPKPGIWRKVPLEELSAPNKRLVEDLNDLIRENPPIKSVKNTIQ